MESTTTAQDETPGWMAELLAEPDEAPVASVWLAQRLRDAGLEWEPSTGDRFVVPDVDMEHQVFLVAPMVVQVRSLPTGRLIAFNGTTEWALDSLMMSEALWLPGETDLRTALGEHFLALRRGDRRWLVDVELADRTATFEHPDAVGALALALLEVLRAG